MAPAKRRYFESVHVGDELPSVAKSPLERTQIVRYAAALNDFSPIHVDEVGAKAGGLPSVVAPSGMAMALLGPVINEWATGAHVQKFSARFFRLLWPGDTFVCRGRVFDREGRVGKYLVDLDVWAENQRGELVVRASATVRLFYSAEDEARAKAGQAPVVMNVARQSLANAPPKPIGGALDDKSKAKPVAKPPKRP